MAFPTIPTGGRVVTALNTAGGATKTFPNLNLLTKNAGDLLIAICIEYDGNSTNAEFSSWGASFTEFGDFAGTTTMAIGCAYKISDGTETGTFTVTTADSSTNDSAFILLSIPGAHQSTPPEAGSFATGTTTVANPTSFNPGGWDAEDTLWIAVGGNGETATGGNFDGITAAPANYTDLAVTGISADVIGGVEGAVAFRQLNAASEDVGTFTLDASNARNGVCVIAVRPVPSHSLAVSDDLGFASSVNLERETFVAVSDDLGFSSAVNLTRQTSIAVSDDLGFASAINLQRETFMQVSDDLGFASAIDLTLEDTGGEPEVPTPDLFSTIVGLRW